MRRIQISLVVVIGLALSFTSAAYAQENVLVIVADNVSPELIEAYGEGSDPAPTPTLDTLAASGVLFKNATSNPFGGPTRATLLTGRYGFRTNVGARKPPTQAPAWTKLDAEEVTIPEMLEAAGAGYRSAALGEWNIGPLPQGFEYYAGAPDDLDWNYLNFTKRRHFPDGTWDDVRVTCDENNTDPVVANHSAGRSKPCYETTNIVDEAILKIGEFETAGAPWLVWVAFHAARSPFHMPPGDLLPTQLNAKPKDEYDPDLDSDKLRAMVEAMDTEIGRLLCIPPQDTGSHCPFPANTTVVFVSDNAGEEDLCSGSPALGSCTRVPLIVSRPGNMVGESAAIVNTTDLFATVAEIAGVAADAEDSVSLLPYLDDPAAPTQDRRSAGGPYAYAEYFHFGVGAFGRAIRDAHYKFVWDYSVASGPSEALYDLDADPNELTNLLLHCSGEDCVPAPPNPGADLTAYRTLALALFKTLHDPDWDEIPYQKDNCTGVHQSDNTCDTDGDGIGNACGCDFNDDGTCDASDESELLAQLDLPMPSNLDPDMNCDGSVDTWDHDLFLAMCDTNDDEICDGDQTPGPSGLYCADPLRSSPGCWPPVVPDSGVTVQENILLIVLDDTVRRWIDPNNAIAPPTPTIDWLARRGVVFDRAYGNSTCSPTRATLHTGLYAFRSGSPWGPNPWHQNFDAPTLAQLLSPTYRTAAFGKLGAILHGETTESDGYEILEGCLQNLPNPDGYYRWPRHARGSTGWLASQDIECAIPTPDDPSFNWDSWDPNYHQDCYATSVTARDAIARIEEFEAAGDPWFVWVGFNAIHEPFHKPPPGLLSPATRTLMSQSSVSDLNKRKAMLEAMDREISNLLLATPSYTTIIIVGDNGTDKGEIVEESNRIPLIIKRPGMAPMLDPRPARDTEAFVNASDVFDTIMDIAGIPYDALDSESLVPYLMEDPPDGTQLRTSTAGPYPDDPSANKGPFPFVYSEMMNDADLRAIRSARFKYITRASGEENLHDFDLDGYGEQVDLLVDPGESGLDEATKNALANMRAAAKNLRDGDKDEVDYRVDSCVEVRNSGNEDCDTDGDGIGYTCDCDLDEDAIGNFCDCDFDNNGVCDGNDMAIFSEDQDSVGEGYWTDMNCDGKVDGLDLGLLLGMCDTDDDGACNDGAKPGPTGLDGCNFDGYCSVGENCSTCASDCISGEGYCCGDSVCEGAEDSLNCALDCDRETCWNMTCEPWEDCETCPDDCEGNMTGPPASRFCCGNGILEGPEGDGSRCDYNY